MAEVVAPVKIPHEIEDVTAEWLTDALATDMPGIVVDDATIVGRIPGASTKARVKLRTNRNDAPVSVIVKAGFEPHSPNMRMMHDNEMHAYRDFAPLVGVNTPKCYFAGRDEAGHSLVILEDLDERGVHFLSLQKPIGFELATGFLDALAQIHARTWNVTRDDIFDWVPDTSRRQNGHYIAILEDPVRFDHFAQSPRCAAMPQSLVDADRMLRVFAAMREYHETQTFVVNHGDMHLGNLYTDADGTPGLLDWQPRYAPWSLDVSYFIIAGLDLLNRRKWEGALLQYYLTKLAAHGVDAPSFDQAWEAYRKTIPWGLKIWMLNGTEFQTESRNTAAAVRFAMAAVDHDMFKLLGV
ncbi:MAG: phosphotransferase [Sphingomonadaceae bacterium]|nr:phosphotransferase [Sphingomonadaceae bacterium]